MRFTALLTVGTGYFLLLSFGTGVPKFGIGNALRFFNLRVSSRPSATT